VVEMEINPIWVYSDRMLSLDANIRIEPARRREAAAGDFTLSERSEKRYDLPDGRAFLMRAILPEDEPELQELVKRIPRKMCGCGFSSRCANCRTKWRPPDPARLRAEMAFVVTEPDCLPGKGKIWGWCAAMPTRTWRRPSTRSW